MLPLRTLDEHTTDVEVEARGPEPVQSEPRPRPWRLVLSGLGWLATGLILGIFAAATVPSLLGYQVLTVRSGSMTPTLHTGDVIVVDPISPLDARIGDVVTFRMPDRAGVLLTHRVQDYAVGKDFVRFETRGDANSAVEEWAVGTDGTIGRVAYRIPRLGYLLGWMDQRVIKIGLVAIPVLLLGAYELVRLWRKPEPEPPEGPDAPA
jgi:signal peptidase